MWSFWRPASIETRIEEVPSPPPAIPVRFVLPAIVRAEGGRAEGLLSKYYDEWGTTRFESRPDLFRRVADRAADLDGEAALPVLGYLAGLLHHITTDSYAGADDLRPRPYAHVDLPTLGEALHQHGRSSASRRPYWERLESLQAWSRIQVPVQGTSGYLPAESAAFGLEWMTVLKDALNQVEAREQGENTSPEEMWIGAIGSLHTFRQSLGRRATDDCWPEVASPEDPRWEPVFDQLRRVDPELASEEGYAASRTLFDLLLLLGVRVGPRVVWYWLDSRRGAESCDDRRHAINVESSYAWFDGDGSGSDVPTSLASLYQSGLIHDYGRFVTLYPYHTAFSGGHSPVCRDEVRANGRNGSTLAAWIWFPDLLPSDVRPFGGHLRAVDAFREAVLSIWPDLAQAVLSTGWYCTRNWHVPRKWDRPIPSLAAYQLSALDLWPARGGGQVVDCGQRRFPLSVMIAWDGTDPPASADPARYFALLDTCEPPLERVAADLRVPSLAGLDLYGAVTRLRWLLEESPALRARSGYHEADSSRPQYAVEDCPEQCWPIQQFGDGSQDVWVAAQYHLLARIVEGNPENLWNRRAIAVGRLALRATRGDVQIAIPVVEQDSDAPCFVGDIDVAFFSQTPRYWEREAHASAWILSMRNQLQSRFYRWAERLGARRISPMAAPAYRGTVVDDPEAVALLRREVRNRLALLLGVFKAHQVEKLDEQARVVLNALASLQAVQPIAPEAGQSGIDAEKQLLFSHPAYRQAIADRRPPAVVLAEGIALLTDQTAAIGDIQNALGSPRGQVINALRFRGIDLLELARTTSALARERLCSVLEQVDRLVYALAVVLGTSEQPLLVEQVGSEARNDWLSEFQALTALRGPLAEAALDAVESVGPSLSLSMRQSLLRSILDEPPAQAMLEILLSVLREAGWTTASRRAFVEAGRYAASYNWGERQGTVDAAMNAAIVCSLLAHLQAGDLDGSDDIVHDLNGLGYQFAQRLSPSATETGVDFNWNLGHHLGVSVSFDPPDELLLEWTRQRWKMLYDALCDVAETTLSGISDTTGTLLRRCLNAGSLLPLQTADQTGLKPTDRSASGSWNGDWEKATCNLT